MTNLDSVFRREWGPAVAALARWSGDLTVAEDAVQEAFADALRTWSRDGVPVNAGAWIVTALAAAVGAAFSQWPYAYACGWSLYTYLGVVGVILVSGAWAAMWAWRARSASAHVVALGVMFWGTVLAAEQILPRIGYAAERAAWSCVAP